MIIDKDTGKVYDLRNELQLERLTMKNESLRSSINIKAEDDKNNVKSLQSSQSTMTRSTYKKKQAWNDFWQQKQKSNEEFLSAAEFGDLEKLKKQLNV